MAGRLSLKIDYKVFSDFADELDKLNADLKSIFTDVMEQEGETIAEDTKEALAQAYLPAHGVFSTGDTEKSIVMNPKVEWSGDLGEMGFGFDKAVPGSGGFLITGTPKMRPDYKLEDIYARKSYERKLVNDIMDYLSAEINDHTRKFK